MAFGRRPEAQRGRTDSFEGYPREVRLQAIMAVAMIVRQVDAERDGDSRTAASYARDAAGCIQQLPPDVLLSDLDVSEALTRQAHSQGKM
jgi:hypothetical protein